MLGCEVEGCCSLTGVGVRVIEMAVGSPKFSLACDNHLWLRTFLSFCDELIDILPVLPRFTKSFLSCSSLLQRTLLSQWRTRTLYILTATMNVLLRQLPAQEAMPPPVPPTQKPHTTG